jgi:hypothetical protein
MLIFRGAIYYSFVDVIPGPSRFECISTEKPNGMDFLSYPDICWWKQNQFRKRGGFNKTQNNIAKQLTQSFQKALN